MNFFNQMKLQWKLVSAFGLILLVTIGSMTFTITRLISLASQVDITGKLIEKYGQRSDTLYYAVQWGYPALREGQSITTYIMSDDPDEQSSLFEKFGKAGKEFKRINKLVKESATTPDELKRIEKLEALEKKFQAEAINIITIRDGEGEYGPETREEVNNFNKVESEFIKAIEEFVEFEKNYMEENQQESNAVISTVNAAASKAITITIFISFLAIVIGVLISLVLARVISKPIHAVVALAKKIAAGDLTQKAEVLSSDEMGEMAQSFNDMIERLGGMVKNIQEASTKISTISDQTAVAATELNSGAESIESASSSIEEMNSAIGEIARGTSDLTKQASDASSSIIEIVASIEDIADISEGLSSTVDQSSSSITEMASSISEITGHASQLSLYATETASSVSQIDATIREVENSIKISAELSEANASDAEAGGETVKMTIQSMEKIQETVQNTAMAIKILGEKSLAIGDIINLIVEIAEEINLLSLNASIIAAQSGEHGKGFAIVASHIKQLSKKTKGYTTEIGGLIKPVQIEVAKAVESMESGASNVEEGVKLSRLAGEALDKMLLSAKSTMDMLEHISRASTEQLRGSKQANESMEKTTQMLTQVYKAIEKQNMGNEYITKATEEMKDAARQVKDTTKKQSQEGEKVQLTIEEITGVTRIIDKATQEQAKGSTQLLKAMEETKSITAGNMSTVKDMKKFAEVLGNQVEALEKAVSTFKVSS
ncbi:MAG: HAMP domain-containing protein [Proteobacteria bacterium]|nr:HAMP domain-containing protein [Pseudomonadota bacterium]